jgi:hypothetical protein
MELDMKEWNAYVDFVSGGEWPIPRGFVSDYNNWLCRSVVGRALYFREKVEEAMTVLSTVVNIEPSMEKPDSGMGEVEHKILCMRDLAKIVWQLTENSDAALKFWDEAVRLCDMWPYNFNSVARGEISYGRLVMLWVAGKYDLVESQLKEMAASERFEMPEYNVNSYRYFAYKFRAETEYNAKNVHKAALIFEEAFKYYPMSVEARREETKAKAMTDMEERYNKFLQMSKTQYIQWEVVGEARGPVRG